MNDSRSQAAQSGKVRHEKTWRVVDWPPKKGKLSVPNSGLGPEQGKRGDLSLQPSRFKHKRTSCQQVRTLPQPLTGNVETVWKELRRGKLGITPLYKLYVAYHEKTGDWFNDFKVLFNDDNGELTENAKKTIKDVATQESMTTQSLNLTMKKACQQGFIKDKNQQAYLEYCGKLFDELVQLNTSTASTSMATQQRTSIPQEGTVKGAPGTTSSYLDDPHVTFQGTSISPISGAPYAHPRVGDTIDRGALLSHEGSIGEQSPPRVLYVDGDSDNPWRIPGTSGDATLSYLHDSYVAYSRFSQTHYATYSGVQSTPYVMYSGFQPTHYVTYSGFLQTHYATYSESQLPPPMQLGSSSSCLVGFGGSQNSQVRRLRPGAERGNSR